MRKKKTKRRAHSRVDDVPMTPMIDVVFNLLVFFVFSYDPVDLFSKLDIIRPQSDPESRPDTPPPEMYEIVIGPRVGDYRTGRPQFSVNKKRATNLEGLEVELEVIASTDPDQTISFISSPQAIHQDLVDALNLCTKHGLRKVNVLPTHHGDRR